MTLSATNTTGTGAVSLTLTVNSSGGSGVQNVAWTNAVGVTASGNSLTRGGADAGWSAGAVSTATLTSGNGYMEFTATETSSYRMCGLSHDNSSQSYTDIDFALFLLSNGSVEIFEDGASRGTFGTYATGDVFRVALVNGVVQYSQNGTLLYTSTVAPPSCRCSPIHSPLLPGATIGNVVISGNSSCPPPRPR